MADRSTAPELLDLLVEDATDLGGPTTSNDPIDWPGYGERLERVRAETGVDEAVLAVRGRVAGSRVEAVFVLWEFGFFGGSMGVVVGERVARAYEAAAEARLPIVLLPATGGARMQEGVASLVQMAKTVVAAQAHAEARLLQVVVLRHPTTGGVFASHINLADVLLAESGATIGFVGPRVAEALTGGPLPSGSHSAEGARAAGLIDAVVSRQELAQRLATLLAWPARTAPRATVPEPSGPRVPAADAWTQVERARSSDRPAAQAYLETVDVASELHGDRAGDDDPAVRVVLGAIAGRPVVVVALDRSGGDGRVTPAGYRLAWRGLRIADRLGVAVLTLIDASGADAGAASEAGGIAHHIARTFVELLAVRSPVVSLVIGESASGGALALAVGDRMLIQEHAVFSVLQTEGAAALLERDASKAPQVAELLKPTAQSLRTLGIADEVVPEPVGLEVVAARAAICRHLDELAPQSVDERLTNRRRRWRAAGGSARAGEVQTTISGPPARSSGPCR
ncbi:MAG: acetyl-CoA carboxylase carboxyl transferase subunit beta [Actinomycetota bacterium]|nr:acetyl-CoA carboxylase carboxyl transferase subunit beta [Actinomycetota bacterium]